MTKKKGTAGNREEWRSAATPWAALSSAATLCTLRAAATTALHHSNGDGGKGNGNGEDDGTSSSVTARRNANPVGIADKDGIACKGRDGGAPWQRRTQRRRGDKDGDGVCFF